MSRTHPPLLPSIVGLLAGTLLAGVPIVGLAATGPPATFATKPPPHKPSPPPKPSGNGSSYTYIPVTTTLSLNPFSGPPNQTVTVTGKWFYYHQQLTIYWDVKTNVLARLTADNYGNFTTTIRVPDDFVGNHTVCVAEAAWVPCQVFGLLPRIATAMTLSLAEGQPGTTVTFSAQNFDPQQPLTLSWGAGKVLGNFIADPAGNVTGRFEMPETKPGSYQLCLAAVHPGQGEQPACQSVTLDAVPVAAATQQGGGSSNVFGYLFLLLALAGGAGLFVLYRRRTVDLPEALVLHRVGPAVMGSTHKEFWDSLTRMAAPAPDTESVSSARPARGRPVTS